MQEARESLGRIVRDANRASDVIKRVRALLKRQDPLKTRLDVGEVIRDVVDLVRHEAKAHGASVRVHLATDVAPIEADRVLVQQVILNLLMNGLEAMDAVVDRPRLLEIGADPHESGAVRIFVRDSGPGVGSDRERIFSPLYTTKFGGMGMGVAISRTIVEGHGGRLWATPNHGPGETFQFTLPAAGNTESLAAT